MCFTQTTEHSQFVISSDMLQWNGPGEYEEIIHKDEM